METNARLVSFAFSDHPEQVADKTRREDEAKLRHVTVPRRRHSRSAKTPPADTAESAFSSDLPLCVLREQPQDQAAHGPPFRLGARFRAGPGVHVDAVQQERLAAVAFGRWLHHEAKSKP
jgi:hypothetical protein